MAVGSSRAQWPPRLAPDSRCTVGVLLAGERLLYMPSIGACLVAALLLDRLPRVPKRVKQVALVAIVAYFAQRCVGVALPLVAA